MLNQSAIYLTETIKDLALHRYTVGNKGCNNVLVGLKYILLHCEQNTVTVYAFSEGTTAHRHSNRNRQNTVIITILLMETYTCSHFHKTGAPACEKQKSINNNFSKDSDHLVHAPF